MDNKIQGLDDTQLLHYTHDIVEPLLQNNQRFIILYVFENFSMWFLCNVATSLRRKSFPNLLLH